MVLLPYDKYYEENDRAIWQDSRRSDKKRIRRT